MKHRKKRDVRVKRWMGRALAALLALLAVAAVGGWAAVRHYDSQIERVDAFAGVSESARPAAPSVPATVNAVQAAQNILLVGSDSRAGEGNSEYGADVEGARADTTMILHVPAGGGGATIVSIPRDSYVTVPQCTSSDGTTLRSYQGKFNSAYAEGGPSCAIAATEALTNIRIDHYIEIDFAGLIAVVDAVGGVDVTMPEGFSDSTAGIDIPAGVSHLDGETALAFVRARKSDPRGDIGRIARQQQLLSTLLQKVKSNDTLLDPTKLKNFLDTATDAVTTDEDLGVSDMVELARSTDGLDLSKVQFATPPVADLDYRVDGASTVLLDETGTAELFAAVQGDLPLPAASITQMPGAAPAVP